MGRLPNIKIIYLAVLLVLETGGDTVKIAISHWNDISGQLEPFLKSSLDQVGAPTPCELNVTDTDCIGGLVPLVHQILDSPKWFDGVNDANKFRLSSGNFIGGESGWLSSLEGNSWLRFGQIAYYHLKPTVTALGIKEFEAGVGRSRDYVFIGTHDLPNPTDHKLNVTLANTCLTTYPDNPPESEFCEVVPKIQIISAHVDGVEPHAIGVIGFVNPLVERLSLPGKLSFSNDTVGSILAEVNRTSGIKTFIALGDGSLTIAKEILDRVPQVKLVIYGMGLTDSKDMSRQYPMKYNHGYIATAGRYGSTVGKLVLDLDTGSGDIVAAAGDLVQTAYVSNNVSPEVQNASDAYNILFEEINKERMNHIGHTRVNLHGGKKCWENECNLGNLVADAMVHCALNKSTDMLSSIFSIWHGGAFFDDIIPAGDAISKFDIHKWLPYHNRAHLVKVKGAGLRKVLQASATGLNPEKANEKNWGQFLQVSNGLEVYYNNDTQDGTPPNVARIRLVHNDNGVPTLKDLDDNVEYYVVINTFMKEGRGVYGFTVKENIWIGDGNLDFDDNCLENYIRALRHVSVGFEERIFIDEDPHPPDCKPCKDNGGGSGKEAKKGQSTAVTVILTIVFSSIFVAVVYIGYFHVIPRLMQARHVDYPPNQL